MEIRSKEQPCKICGGKASEAFRIPKSKQTGHPIPEGPDDCIYYECTSCGFCFTDFIDHLNHSKLYDENYWNTQDPDWYGRIPETLRLVLLANTLLNKDPWNLDILDFGCGMGTFVQSLREKLNMKAWGHDIIEPKFGKDFFLRDLPEKMFDIVVCCEVLEHLHFPMETLVKTKKSLKANGVLAFQTAYYDPRTCGRDWWYVGPANGHVSLYSVGAFDEMFERLGGKKKIIWDHYPGIQAWQFDPSGPAEACLPKETQGAEKVLESVGTLARPGSIKIRPRGDDLDIIFGNQVFQLKFADLMEGVKQVFKIQKIGLRKIFKAAFKIGTGYYRR